MSRGDIMEFHIQLKELRLKAGESQGEVASAVGCAARQYQRFEKGEPQRQLSKEFVRQWLIENGFMGKAGQQVPEMTDEYCESVSNRYIELYEHITGLKFEKKEDADINARIEKNVTEYLNSLKK